MDQRDRTLSLKCRFEGKKGKGEIVNIPSCIFNKRP